MRPLNDASPPVTGRVDSLPQGAKRRCDALFAACPDARSGWSEGQKHLTGVSNRAKMVGAVTQPLSTLTTRNRRASMPQSSAGPEVWRGERNEQRASDTC